MVSFFSEIFQCVKEYLGYLIEELKSKFPREKIIGIIAIGIIFIILASLFIAFLFLTLYFVYLLAIRI